MKMTSAVRWLLAASFVLVLCASASAAQSTSHSHKPVAHSRKSHPSHPMRNNRPKHHAMNTSRTSLLAVRYLQPQQASSVVAANSSASASASKSAAHTSPASSKKKKSSSKHRATLAASQRRKLPRPSVSPRSSHPWHAADTTRANQTGSGTPTQLPQCKNSNPPTASTPAADSTRPACKSSA